MSRIDIKTATDISWTRANLELDAFCRAMLMKVKMKVPIWALRAAAFCGKVCWTIHHTDAHSRARSRLAEAGPQVL